MRVLMLGNSFTFVNDMPKTLAELTDAEVIQHTCFLSSRFPHLGVRTKTWTSTMTRRRFAHVFL